MVTWSLQTTVVAKAINAKPVVVATKVDTITAKAILVPVRMVSAVEVCQGGVCKGGHGLRKGGIGKDRRTLR